MTFILILTFSLLGVGGNSVSITSAEFNSKAACQEAGRASIESFDTLKDGSSKTSNFICVRK